MSVPAGYMSVPNGKPGRATDRKGQTLSVQWQWILDMSYYLRKIHNEEAGQIRRSDLPETDADRPQAEATFNKTKIL